MKERDAKIAELLRSGEHTLQAIGNVFGLTRESIRRIANREGIPKRNGFASMRARAKKRRASAANVAVVLADYRSGLCLERVGEKHGLRRDAIRQLLVDSGETVRRSSFRGLGSNTTRVMELHREGLSQSEIADSLGISIDLVKAIRFRYKLVKRDRVKTAEQSYPYLQKSSDDPTGLLALVNALVPREVPHFIRADVCQDVLLAILEERVHAGANLTTCVRKALTKVRKMHPFLFAPISLDQEIPGTDGLRMIDMIRSDQPHF